MDSGLGLASGTLEGLEHVLWRPMGSRENRCSGWSVIWRLKPLPSSPRTMSGRSHVRVCGREQGLVPDPVKGSPSRGCPGAGFMSGGTVRPIRAVGFARTPT